MTELECVWFSKGKCLKGLPGTKCEVVGCVVRNEERLDYNLKEFQFLKINGGFDAMNKRAEEAAMKAYPKSDFDGVETRRKGNRKCFIEGYARAKKDTVTLIESRIGEILGDAQPAPVLRIELRELINKIKEQ